MRRILREPLVHFFLLGAGLFALYGLVGGRDAPATVGKIVVDDARVEALRLEFERLWQRPPSAAELDGIVEDWIREEILYREGLALGLDRDDPVLKRRIAQKVLFMFEQAGRHPPTEQQLESWFAERAGVYRIEPVYTFRQVFFDPAKRAGTLDQDVAASLAALAAGADPADAGDSTLLPEWMTETSDSSVRRTFGDRFAAALAGVEPGRWTGPLPSAYGVHLVYVEAMAPARAATLAEVRAAVERDFEAAAAEAADAAFHAALRERYRVRIDANLDLADEAATAGGAAGDDARP